MIDALSMKIKCVGPWAGGKRRLAKRIVELLGPHDTYVEPFVGGCSILPVKPKCDREYVYDLTGVGVGYEPTKPGGQSLPARGLAFLQFDGPWMAAGVPVGAAYRHCHWVASVGDQVYDANPGRWMPRPEWEADVMWCGMERVHVSSNSRAFSPRTYYWVRRSEH